MSTEGRCAHAAGVGWNVTDHIGFLTELPVSTFAEAFVNEFHIQAKRPERRRFIVSEVFPWGAETRSPRCGVFVFVDEAAEEVAPMHMKILRLQAGCDG